MLFFSPITFNKLCLWLFNIFILIITSHCVQTKPIPPEEEIYDDSTPYDDSVPVTEMPCKLSNDFKTDGVVGIKLKGNFSNNAIQYGFLNIYAKRHHLKINFPNWLGRRLFALRNPPLSPEVDQVVIDSPEVLDSFTKKSNKVYKNVSFTGYFQYHTSAYRDDKQCFQELFTPTPEIKEELDKRLNNLRSPLQTLIVLHLRRGDFLVESQVITKSEWYKDWLKINWNKFPNPILYIASDSLPEVLPDFAEFKPYSIKNLDLKGLTIDKRYVDFYIMTQADVLGGSKGSTFSFVPALLNKKAKIFLMPKLNEQSNIYSIQEFDPWNSYMYAWDKNF